MRIKQTAPLMLTALLGLGVLSGCASSSASHDMHMSGANTAAADLRVTLDRLLGEHVVLATNATGAALGGRGAEFKGAAAALDANSVDIAQAIGSVYGEAAGDSFLPLWRTHIGFVVDYTKALAGKDMRAQKKAVNDLMQYAEDFGAFIHAATPALPKEAVAETVRQHAVSLKTVIDAQAAGEPKQAQLALREAYGHMSHMASALAGAIVEQFPERY